MDTTGSYGTGKIRRLERRLLFVTSRLSDRDAKMSDGVRGHMIDEKEALEWALPILRRHVCYEIDGEVLGRDRYLDTLDDKADRLERLARELRSKSMSKILRTTDTEGGNPV